MRIVGTNEHEVQIYMNQFVLTICTCINTSFDKNYILTSLPHEAQKQLKHEHAKNVTYEISM